MLPALLLYLFFLIVRPHEFLAATVSTALPHCMLVLAFLLWLFESGKTFSAPQQILVPVFCLAAVVSRVLLGWFSGALLAIEEFVPLLMLLFISTTVAEEPAARLHLLRFTCLCTLVLVAHGFQQILNDGVGFTGQGMEGAWESRRIQYIGIFADPNDLAMLFVFCFPLTCYLGWQSGWVLRLFWWVAAALLAVGIWFTDSRGGLLALIVVCVAWSLRHVGRVATGVIATLGLPALFAATRLSNLGADEESAAGRVDAWSTALLLFRERPLTGVGYGLFTEHNDLTAHNSWLLVLGELGLVGYIPWFCAVGLSMQQLWTMTFRRGEPRVADDEQGVAVAIDRGSAGAMFYGGVGMLAAAFFLSRSYSLQFYFLWAWTAGLYKGARRRDPTLPAIGLHEFGMKWVGLAIASVAAFYLITRILAGE